jgi:hypothetical protein
MARWFGAIPVRCRCIVITDEQGFRPRKLARSLGLWTTKWKPGCSPEHLPRHPDSRHGTPPPPTPQRWCRQGPPSEVSGPSLRDSRPRPRVRAEGGDRWIRQRRKGPVARFRWAPRRQPPSTPEVVPTIRPARRESLVASSSLKPEKLHGGRRCYHQAALANVLTSMRVEAEGGWHGQAPENTRRAICGPAR